MNYDHVFDSSAPVYEEEYKIDYENDVPVVVLFEKEGVILRVDRNGNAVFRDPEGRVLFEDRAVGRNRYFSKVYCRVKDNAIAVRFPILEFRDNYPHCDGEYDRWDEITVDNVVITYAVGK